MADVLIDAYGTVFDVDAVARVCESWYPGSGEHISRIWRQKQLEYSWLCSLMETYVDFEATNERSLRFALEQLEKPQTQEALTAILEAYLSLPVHPDAVQALAAWDDVNVSILSNGTPQMLDALVDHAGLTSYFDRILSADSVKVYKPSPRVYAHGAAQVGKAKEHIVFISSNGWDVAGAKTFGFRTIWVNRKGQPPEQISPPPDFTVRKMTEVTPEMLHTH